MCVCVSVCVCVRACVRVCVCEPKLQREFPETGRQTKHNTFICSGSVKNCLAHTLRGLHNAVIAGEKGVFCGLFPRLERRRKAKRNYVAVDLRGTWVGGGGGGGGMGK